MEIIEQTVRLKRYRITHEGRTIACLNPGSAEVWAQLRRPTVHPFYTPSGIPVTEHGAHNFPHHKGIWISHPNVSGFEFFADEVVAPERPLGRQVVAELRTFTSGDEARLTLAVHWMPPERRPLVHETRTLRFARAGSANVLDIMSSFVAAGQAVDLTKEIYGFCSVRVLDAIDEDDGGRMQDADGRVGEAQVFGSPAPWVDCSGSVGQQRAGLTLLVHPQSPPSRFTARNYGTIQADPCFDHGLRVEEGQALVQRWRVVAHDGDAEAFDVPQAYASFAATPFELPPVA